MANTEWIHFNDSILFEIEQITRYSQIMAKEFFDKFEENITHEEFRTLDVLICNPHSCQRDLAKLILRDRTYTGRLIDSLEKKGFVERFNDSKGKRLVKKMNITEKGLKFYNTVIETLRPTINKMAEKFTLEQSNELKRMLRHLKDTMSMIVNVNV